MEFRDLVQSRRSVKSYQPGRDISDEDLASLFEDVGLSPSAFNLQHAHFIAYREPEQKQALMQIAFNQPQVGDCSVAFLVCGKLSAWKDAAEIYREAPQEVQDKMIPMIHDFYKDQERLQRDEAIRSASLSAMSLMLAARDRGWVTGPMIGFDPDKAAEFAELPDDVIPVMLLVLGYQKNEPRPRAYRRPVREVVRWNRFRGPGLKSGQ